MLYVMLCCQYPVRSCPHCGSVDVPPHGQGMHKAAPVYFIMHRIWKVSVTCHNRTCEMM